MLDNIRKAQKKQKKQYDKQTNKINEFIINDFIILENNRQVVGHVRAFEPKFRGPYKVLRKSDDVNYVIKEVETNKAQKVHVIRIHHYFQRVENANIEDELLERRRRILMTKTISRKNAESNNVDMDDIPNLEN